MDIMKNIVFALCLSLAGCATSSGVLKLGPDTYTVSREGGGFTKLTSLKADALREAGEFCASEGKSIRVNNMREERPIMAGFPRAEVEFMCLEKGDKELTRPKKESEPNQTIEIRTK
jgi:hypothetical protein